MITSIMIDGIRERFLSSLPQYYRPGGWKRQGPVRVKHAFGLGVQKAKPEYEDIADLARKNGVSLQAVRDEVAKKG